MIAPAAGKVFKEAHSYDVISIYPSVMRDCPIPGGNIFWLDQMTLNHFGFVQVVARAPAGKQACLLPAKVYDGHSSSLGFVGHDRVFTGWYLTAEVAAAVAYGYQVELGGGYVFDKLEGGFTSFVSESFKGRQIAKREGEVAMAGLYKAVLNSLYGRFAIHLDWDSWAFAKAGK